jgi:hypothetical protein
MILLDNYADLQYLTSQFQLPLRSSPGISIYCNNSNSFDRLSWQSGESRVYISPKRHYSAALVASTLSDIISMQRHLPVSGTNHIEVLADENIGLVIDISAALSEELTGEKTSRFSIVNELIGKRKADYERHSGLELRSLPTIVEVRNRERLVDDATETALRYSAAHKLLYS